MKVHLDRKLNFDRQDLNLEASGRNLMGTTPFDIIVGYVGQGIPGRGVAWTGLAMKFRRKEQ